MKHVTAGTKCISLEQLRKVLGLESVKDADAKIIQKRLYACLRVRFLLHAWTII